MSYKPRYFFDWNAGVCREFVYGGCEGNANNFDDVDACERTCAQYMNRPPGELKEKAWAYSRYSKCYKISNTFVFLFSSKMMVSRSGIHKILVKIAYREYPDQTASEEAV